MPSASLASLCGIGNSLIFNVILFTNRIALTIMKNALLNIYFFHNLSGVLTNRKKALMNDIIINTIKIKTFPTE